MEQWSLKMWDVFTDRNSLIKGRSEEWICKSCPRNEGEENNKTVLGELKTSEPKFKR